MALMTISRLLTRSSSYMPLKELIILPQNFTVEVVDLWEVYGALPACPPAGRKAGACVHWSQTVSRGDASSLLGCVLASRLLGDWRGSQKFAGVQACRGNGSLCLLGCPSELQLKLQVALGLWCICPTPPSRPGSSSKPPLTPKAEACAPPEPPTLPPHHNCLSVN